MCILHLFSRHFRSFCPTLSLLKGKCRKKRLLFHVPHIHWTLIQAMSGFLADKNFSSRALSTDSSKMDRKSRGEQVRRICVQETWASRAENI